MLILAIAALSLYIAYVSTIRSSTFGGCTHPCHTQTGNDDAILFFASLVLLLWFVALLDFIWGFFKPLLRDSDPAADYVDLHHQ
jgi:hypothetical protein